MIQQHAEMQNVFTAKTCVRNQPPLILLF